MPATLVDDFDAPDKQRLRAAIGTQGLTVAYARHMASDAPRSLAIDPLQMGLAMHTALVDRLAARMSVAFSRAGIPHVLLKGAALAQWLYGPDELRTYGDADFLVPIERWDDAGAVLRDAGFSEALDPLGHPRMESYTSHPWSSPAGDVDLHASLYGLNADFQTVWRELGSQPDRIELEGVQVPVLPISGRLLHVALHVAQHPELQSQTSKDLERALARVSFDAWRDAARLAERLGALPTFAAGLVTVPESRALAERLGIADVSSVDTLLRAAQVPLAEALNELLATPGLRAKLRALVRELAPTPDFMRWWLPRRASGRIGLALAYVWRPIYLVSRLPAAIRAVWRARRAAGNR
jgi:hypothetical protein